jgi:predicted AAA+ superfamily ATPase
MTQFVLDADDLSTEDDFLKYKHRQRVVRARAAQVWQANYAALEEWGEFGSSLTEGGELERLAAYNAAYAGQLAGMEAQLQASIANTQAIIQAMQAAVPGELFPGVPKAGAE